MDSSTVKETDREDFVYPEGVKQHSLGSRRSRDPQEYRHNRSRHL